MRSGRTGAHRRREPRARRQVRRGRPAAPAPRATAGTTGNGRHHGQRQAPQATPAPRVTAAPQATPAPRATPARRGNAGTARATPARPAARRQRGWHRRARRHGRRHRGHDGTGGRGGTGGGTAGTAAPAARRHGGTGGTGGSGTLDLDGRRPRLRRLLLGSHPERQSPRCRERTIRSTHGPPGGCPTGATWDTTGYINTRTALTVGGTPARSTRSTSTSAASSGTRCYTGGTAASTAAGVGTGPNNTWYAGGRQSSDSIWNTLEIRVAPPIMPRDGQANAAFENYFVNSFNTQLVPERGDLRDPVQRRASRSWVAARSPWSNHDSNCRTLANCGAARQTAAATRAPRASSTWRA